MTRPTEEQIRAMKPGGRYTTEHVLHEVGNALVIDGAGWAAPLDTIASIEPRPLEVGDRVKWVDGFDYEVAAPARATLDGGEVDAVIGSDAAGYQVACASDLERIA